MQVSDCYIWAEIYYLDSPTDYREFLPDWGDIGQSRVGDLILLDDAKHSSGTKNCRFPGWLLLAVALLFLLGTLIVSECS